MARRSLRHIFARKSVEQMHDEHEHGELKKSLGAVNLVLLGIGCIIGTGIFVLTGRAAAQFAGPAIVVSFIITGTLCALVALSYAELASAIPVSGSAYSYSYASLGEIAAWVMGLLLVLEYGLAASTVAVGWSGYMASFLHDFGLDIPPPLRGAWGTPISDFVTGATVGTGVVNLPAVIATAAVTGLLVLGVSESAFVNNIVVAIKVTVVVAFIAIGGFFVNPSLWSPFVPAAVPPPPGDAGLWSEIGAALWAVVTAGNTGQYGVSGIITAAATIFFAYIGFEAVSTAGAESKNPRRDMPIGILGSLIICTILYILTSAVLVGIVPYTDLNDAAPIAKAVNQIGLPWFAVLVKIGAIAGLSSVMLVLLYGQTRIFYTMARDGLIPPVFAQVHPRLRTPWVNTLIVGVLACGFAGFMGLDALANLTNVGTLFAFAIVCFTVIYLRYTRPQMQRPFRTPLFPLTPVLGAAMCLFLLMSLIAHEATRNFF
jgi:APA family basic amino acid/polyamine antiporter